MILAIAGALTQHIMTKQIMPKTTGPKKRLKDLLAEAANGKEQDQSEVSQIVTNNMMKFMPIMMLFIMISIPGALALYYVASNVVAVAQQAYILREDEEELEDLADQPESLPTTKAKNQRVAQKRAKEAKEAHITRIVAKDTGRRK